MNDGKIHLQAKKIERLKPGQQPVIRLTVEAYDALAGICSKTSLSVKEVASEIIIQGAGMIVFDKNEED